MSEYRPGWMCRLIWAVGGSGPSWRWWTASAGRGRTWPGWETPGARRTLADVTPGPAAADQGGGERVKE